MTKAEGSDRYPHAQLMLVTYWKAFKIVYSDQHDGRSAQGMSRKAERQLVAMGFLHKVSARVQAWDAQCVFASAILKERTHSPKLTMLGTHTQAKVRNFTINHALRFKSWRQKLSNLSKIDINKVLESIFNEANHEINRNKTKAENYQLDVRPKPFVGEAPDYMRLLQDRYLFKKELPGLKSSLANSIRSVFRQEDIVVLLLIGIFLIGIFSFLTSCKISMGMFPGCQTHTRTEFYDIQVLRRESANSSQYNDTYSANKLEPVESVPQNFTKNRTEISKSETYTHYFNIEMFKNLVLSYSLILAFVRWHLSNLQSGMSEIFERKRSVNNLIMSNKSDIEDLVSGALEFSDKPKSMFLKGPISLEECTHVVRDCLEDSPFGNKGPSFIQQMFVYIELDNLELALKKYKDGYLEDEQMYRACEIFESRCMTKYFRYLAANQGLRNYTLGFHKLLIILLIFGYYKEPEDIELLKKNGFVL